MTVWIIEPQDPLIVRDGRPFHATPGARARSLPFPFPSTTAGGVRTRAGQGEDGLFNVSEENIAAVKKIIVRGPLLVEQNDAGEWKFLVPSPADALVFDEEEENGELCAEVVSGIGIPDTKIERKWLRPLTMPAGANSDKPEDLDYLIGLPNPDSRKPSKNAPAFWHWDKFADWLNNPAAETAPLSAADLGHDGPQPDRRIHVGIDPDKFTSLDGALFATSGLTFWHQSQAEKLTAVNKLALAVDVKNQGKLTIDNGFAPLGGERRLMNWQKKENNTLPVIPPKLIETIENNDGCCRLILLTPAYFKAGWRPDFGKGVELLATAVSNPVVVSGWDFEKRKPKPTKRLAPAGSVYFVKVSGDVEQWVNSRWLRSLSDDDELEKAGFGLTAVGVWDGKAHLLIIKKEENNG